MPSDPRVSAALEALAGSIERYRTTVAATLEEVRGLIATAQADVYVRAGRMKDQLGSFADGRIDTGRLAELLGDRGTLGADAVAHLERAARALVDVMHEGHSLAVAPGEDLGGRVGWKLGIVGRAFAAARLAANARAGIAETPPLDAPLEAFPYREWSGPERRLAPPLVVSVRGADLNAAALAPFLDGVQKLVFVVDGPCAPAPLVRLITPNVLVIQAHDLEGLRPLAAWPGPAVGAWMPATAARFVHDPAAGDQLWQRMTVQPPADAPLQRINGTSAIQQREELLQLAAISTAPVGVTADTPNPLERLTSWLLEHAAAD